MSRRPPLPTHALRSRREARSERLLANRAVADALVSVAAIVGQRVRLHQGAEVGRLVDLVARWEGDSYPPVTGLVVRVGRRLAFVPMDHVETLTVDEVRLSSARFDLRDFAQRPGEVLLAGDVIDHQVVDVDGIRVVRVSDLYLARLADGVRLVGGDVGLHSLVRRLGPARWRRRSTPERVIDWAAIQPFGTASGPVRLRRTNEGLARLRPSELADLLEELGRPERQELLEALEPESAADALEEMDATKLDALLRDLPTDRAADLLADMEPDEAVDALRLLDDTERDGLLDAMPTSHARRLRQLLQFPERTAGGLMTTQIVTARPGESVNAIRDSLREAAEHRADIDCVILVDHDGRLIDDISVFELFTASPEQSVSDLAAPPWPLTVTSEVPLDDVVRHLIDSRGSSLIVVDGDGRPVGRILADDVVDALVSNGGRTRMRRH